MRPYPFAPRRARVRVASFASPVISPDKRTARQHEARMALSGEAPAAYVVRFTASKVEDAFETVFAAKGAALGAVSARSETDFALSHADRATPCLLTEAPRVVDVPIDDALLAAAERLRAAEFDARAPDQLRSAAQAVAARWSCLPTRPCC